MNPGNGQTPLDYLNQISAPQQQKGPMLQLNLKTILLIGGALVVVVIGLALIIGMLTGGKETAWQQLDARLTTTVTIVDDASANIKNNRLKSVNSDLKLYLANSKRDLAEILTANKVSVKETPKTLLAKENGEAMIKRLEDGRLNAKFDSTYSRELSYQLSTLLSLYQKLYAENNGVKTRAFLTNAYDNLLPMQKTLQNYSASNE